MNISRNTVLITGGASGIGYAMAKAFLDAGSTVVICGRNSQRLLEAGAKHSELHTRVCDVSSEKDRQELLKWASTHVPGLNVLAKRIGCVRGLTRRNFVRQPVRDRSGLKRARETWRSLRLWPSWIMGPPGLP